MAERIFVTIDPGLGGTGICLWHEDTLEPTMTAIIKVPDSYGDWLVRSNIMSSNLGEILKMQPLIQQVYIEYPLLMQTASGMASAIRGDVFKLMFLVGCFAQQVWNYNHEFVPLPVNDWKGQLPKEVVAKRVCQILRCESDRYGDHVMDAVGMGLYLKGVFNGSDESEPVRRRKPG